MLKSESGVENSDPVEKTHQITCVAFVHEIIWRLCLLSLSRDRVNKLQLQLTPHFIKKNVHKIHPLYSYLCSVDSWWNWRYDFEYNKRSAVPFPRSWEVHHGTQDRECLE